MCHTYSWHLEDWGDCSIDQSVECGQGIINRKVTCKRSDSVMVDDSYCNETLAGERPRLEKMCGTPCPGDCVVNINIVISFLFSFTTDC